MAVPNSPGALKLLERELKSGISNNLLLDLIYGGRKEFYMRAHFEDEGIWHKTAMQSIVPLRVETATEGESSA